MRSLRNSKVVTKLLVVAAVLAVGSGATNASAGAGAPSPQALEIARLQQAWGPRVVHDAVAVQGTRLILVGTVSRALLASRSPQRWLSARLPIVVMYAGTTAIAEDECGAMGMHAAREHLPA